MVTDKIQSAVLTTEKGVSEINHAIDSSGEVSEEEMELRKIDSNIKKGINTALSGIVAVEHLIRNHEHHSWDNSTWGSKDKDIEEDINL